MGQVGDDGQQRQQQAERGAVAVPQVYPPGQGLFMLHLVGAHAQANGVGLRLGQPGGGAAEPLQQGLGVGLCRRDEEPGLCGGQLPADAGAGQRLQQGQAPEVPHHAARAHKTGEDLTQNLVVHGSAPDPSGWGLLSLSQAAHGDRSKLRMQARRHHVDRPAVGVVGRVVDVLPIQRDPCRLCQLQVVEYLEHRFRAVVQSAVADEKPSAARGQVGTVPRDRPLRAMARTRLSCAPHRPGLAPARSLRASG